MSDNPSARGPQAVTRFLRPRSVAIIGISSRPRSAGQIILQSLKVNGFQGDIHLVGRSEEPIDGHPVLKSADDLPEGVDLAVLTLPAAAVPEALAACQRRRTGSAMVFAAGFAETGDRDLQDRISASAREAGLAIVGPNCLGYTNNVDGMMLHMLFARQARTFTDGAPLGVAIVGQSGGMLGHLQRAADARNIPNSYIVSTGNEAGLDVVDFIEFLTQDRATGMIALYVEQIKRPQEFLEACRQARAAGKPVVMLHPGRSQKAQLATQSHTGSLAGDHTTMRTLAEHAGVLMVDTMDEMTDVISLLVPFPKPPAKGPAIMTASGAFVALVNDFAEQAGLEIPSLEPETERVLTGLLPAYAACGNPLDVTAGVSPDSLAGCVSALLDDSNVGMLFISYPIHAGTLVDSFNKGMEGRTKPVAIVGLGDASPLTPDVIEAVSRSPAAFSRSSDRMLRAIALYTAYGRRLAKQTSAAPPAPLDGLPEVGRGAQPEWRGKSLLAAAGIAVPEGGLARDEDEAAAIAGRIGYPVVLKAQAGALTHKTEVGGVLLNIADEADLRAAWTRMIQNVSRAAPSIVLDGILVERMSPKGLELMVGAKRDPAWGTVLMLGLGGIWVEALGDVKCLPGDADEAAVVEALHGLRSAKLLGGFRGAPAVDVDAVARIAVSIGRLMKTVPQITEIDINPLVVHARGDGATALDALIVAQE